jgi:glutamate synthase domain-containing protein 2
VGWASRAIPAAAALAAAAVAVRDLRQRKHALLRNYPLLGHARYMLESIGPELRQYLVAGNNEERPFTRDQRRWVYASAKKENNYFGFGTDNDIEYTAGYPIISHRTFGRAIPPSSPAAGYEVVLPCAKVLGAARGRRHAFRPQSVINIAAMSFGSLSGNAVAALNAGAALAGCLHNTGEGASPRTTAGVVSWCFRSAPPISAAETKTAGSVSTALRNWWLRRRYGRWRSS